MSLLSPHAVAPGTAGAAAATRTTVLFAAVGAVLSRYDVDAENAMLTRRESITLPADVQYAWPHLSRKYFYVACSASGPGPNKGVPSTEHYLSALRIDPASGALTPHGDPIRLPARPIHMTLDAGSTHALVAFNEPSALRVYRIDADGTLAGEVHQPAAVEAGIYAHQVRVTPNGRRAILVARGNRPTATKPEEPGVLLVFDYRDGVLSNPARIAPGGGYGFGPRHLDFHPTRPWVYLSLETQNKLDMFPLDGDTLAAAPAFRKETLADPGIKLSRQAAGTVHVHPNGRSVYIANRASETEPFGTGKVFRGGENTLAAYAIDQDSGEPVPMQHIDTRGIHCRTFHIDPSGRLLVAAHIQGLPVREGAGIRDAPCCLSAFRIDQAGKLEYVRKYDVDTGGKLMFWMGMVTL
ncbi:MAG: beta-propeller fold lactonase family protein [Burkholderiales bacterium]|nr:beta-propeller fold lactonase family protein [Burkholderiales bacterium]